MRTFYFLVFFGIIAALMMLIIVFTGCAGGGYYGSQTGAALVPVPVPYPSQPYAPQFITPAAVPVIQNAGFNPAPLIPKPN